MPASGSSPTREELFAGVTKAELPVLDELIPQAIVQAGFGPAVTFDNLVLVYDTTKVKGTPTSLAELWKPEYKGKIGLGGDAQHPGHRAAP